MKYERESRKLKQNSQGNDKTLLWSKMNSFKHQQEIQLRDFLYDEELSHFVFCGGKNKNDFFFCERMRASKNVTINYIYPRWKLANTVRVKDARDF